MNKKQLEQLFDEKFEAVYEGTRLKIFKNDHDFNKVKDFIFQTVIPEVLTEYKKSNIIEVDKFLKNFNNEEHL